jgi:precorrin-6Y C5,15-methyltransferase (decarboxylating)
VSAAGLTVVGVDARPLTPEAGAALAAAEIVVGAARHLAAVPMPPAAERIELGPVEPALAAIAGRKAVVLASGDPGFFGIVRLLRERGFAPVVLPAVSSVQALFARLGRPWDDVTVVSAHGRALGPAVNVCRARPAVAVLTAPGAGPAEIGAAMHGWPRTLVVAEDLGGPGERLTTLPAEEATDRTWDPLAVVLSLRDPDVVPARGWIAGGEPVPAPGGWALPDDAFEHRAGMVTKSEVRALALARLAPRPGELVWDVGAGSGSVGVECARLGAAVVAVERRPDDVARIVANAAAHSVEVRVVDGEAPAALAGLPAPDAVFVGGGGPEVVAAVAAAGPARVVVALAALDRIAPTRAALLAAGYRVEGTQVAASRLADLPDGTVRLAATNPVTILWGTR